MARKSQILRLITLIALMGLFIIIMLNIFGSGESYYYIHVERKLQMQQQKHLHSPKTPKVWPNIPFENKTIELAKYIDFDILTVVPQIQSDIPSLPITYYFNRWKRKLKGGNNCTQYPAIQMLNFYNTYWQTFHSGQIIFHLYGAYYDTRHPDGPFVRILAMSNHIREEFPLNYCQFWFEDDGRPILTEIIEYKIIWRKHWGVPPLVYYPYLMTCKLPENMDITGNPIPRVVNLVENQCDIANNSLRIIYDKLEDEREKQKFAVCVKGLDYPYEDYSKRLVEWLEMLKLLGVKKVYMYELQIHPNMKKVLDYYVLKGFVEVQKTSLVGGVVDSPHLEHWLLKTYPLNKRLNELIHYNDCFYRSMYKYDYIALLDIDEIIMPQADLKTWQDLVTLSKSLIQKDKCPLGLFSLCARNVYYPTVFENQLVPSNTYPNYMHMLNHGYRFANFSPPYLQIKCLHDTQNVIALHNHFPISYLNNSCEYQLPTNYAQMQHYRNIIPKTIVDELVGGLKWDNNMERFIFPLIERCTKVLKELKLIS